MIFPKHTPRRHYIIEGPKGSAVFFKRFFVPRRDENGYWTQIESYLQSKTDATFTHGICNECAAKMKEYLKK